MTIRKKKKNADAVRLGRRGGKARMKTMSAKQRSAIAKKAAAARWRKTRTDHISRAAKMIAAMGGAE